MHGIEFNISELEQEMEVSRQTLSKVLKKFDEWGLVHSRVSGKAIYYSINEESPLVKSIVQLNNVLIETMLGTETLYEIREYLEERIPQVEPIPFPGYRHVQGEEVWKPGWKSDHIICRTATTRDDISWTRSEPKVRRAGEMSEMSTDDNVAPVICERGAEYAA
jgi:DNA-binding transcriptional ArsR family regulator